MADYFVHNSSYVDEGAIIGEGTKIWHFCHVMPTAQIGMNCVLGQNIFVGNDVVVGNGVKIQNNVSLYTGVIVEDNVFLGPSMVFTNVVNPRSAVERKSEFKKTLLRKGVSIGANATIICGVELGEYAFIGAGAVIVKNVKPYALMVGVPAQQIGWMCKCGERLNFESQDIVCDSCEREYQIKNDQVICLGNNND